MKNLIALGKASVCFGSLADIAAALPNVRFTPESGHHRKRSSCPPSARSRLMMSHLESHHPWPIKTALSSGSLLRINDRAFHNSPELNAAVTAAPAAI